MEKRNNPAVVFSPLTAKFSRKLIRRIYEHAIEEGWISEGSKIIDPFGGVGLGALDAMYFGMDWTGIEIEPRFCALAVGGECDGKIEKIIEEPDIEKDVKGWYVIERYVNSNDDAEQNELKMYMGKDEYFLEHPTSDGFETEEEAKDVFKKLCKDLEFSHDVEELDDLEGGIKIEYRTFEHKPIERIKPATCGKKEEHEPHHVKGNIELWDEKYKGKLSKWGRARMIQGDSRNAVKLLASGDVAVSSPPYSNAIIRSRDLGKEGFMQGATQGKHSMDAYGDEEGQLGQMKDNGIDCAVASPPFKGVSSDGGWQMLGKYAEEGKLTVDQVKGDKSKLYPSWNPERDTSYGNAEGNLAQMPEGDFDVSIASPPFLAQSGGTNVTCKEGALADESLLKRHSAGNASAHGYGDKDGNLGNMKEGEYDVAVGSPPFSTAQSGGGIAVKGYGEGDMVGDRTYTPDTQGKTPGQLSAMKANGFDVAVGSPPFCGNNVNIGAVGDTDGMRQEIGGEKRNNSYGTEDGNLGNMDSEDYDIAVGSPPYAETIQTGVSEPRESDRQHRIRIGRNPDSPGSFNIHDYGEAPGQLGAMKANGFDAALGSPPYAHTPISVYDGSMGEKWRETGETPRQRAGGRLPSEQYGEGVDGNLGRMDDDGFDVAVASPPYAGTPIGEYADKRKNFVEWIENELSTKGFIEWNGVRYTENEWRALNYGRLDGRVMRGAPKMGTEGYNPVNEDNMGNMRDDGFEAAVGSPPYSETRIEGRGDEGSSGLRNPDGSYVRGSEGWEARKELGERYGSEEGQLGAMKDDGFDASVSSPPFEDMTGNRPSQQILDSLESGKLSGLGSACRGDGYGDTEGNIGEESGDDFWMAARKILENLYVVLKPGGKAIWVVKSYIKNGKVEDFPGKWARLCEATGFKVIHIHRAWQVEDRGTQYDIFGNKIEKKVKRVSFFRRLYEKKYPENAIDYEVVLCTEKMDYGSGELSRA